MSAHTSTHYETLGVSKTASQEEIKKAFRKLSMECHPDLHPDNHRHASGEAFKKLSNAHSALSNVLKRQSYDRKLTEDRMWKQATTRDTRYYGPRGGHTNVRYDFGGARMRPPKSTNPMGVVAGIFGLGGVILVGSSLLVDPKYHHSNNNSNSSNNNNNSKEPMVEAWWNPNTFQYEEPAPWDPTYQRIKPKLTMVARDKVRIFR